MCLVSPRGRHVATLVLADAGQTVTVVDANLRKPSVAEYLGMTGGAGPEHAGRYRRRH
jgi:Mrp family chromosome partitioning ATPase